MNTFKFIVSLIVWLTLSPPLNAQLNTIIQEDNNGKVNLPNVSQEPRLTKYVPAMESGNFHGLPGFRIDNLVSRTPVNGQPISQNTVVFLSYGENNIYAIFMCFDDTPHLIRSTMAARDGFSADEDSVAIHLIPFANSQQLYGFQVNAAGSQIDGIYNEGAGWDLSFDQIWFTESLSTKNGYLIKIKLPFSSLRFPPGDSQNWGYFVYRGIPKNNEDAFYPQYSSKISSRISQAGTLGNINVDRRVLRIEATPFITSNNSQSKSSLIDDGWEKSSAEDIGLDAKFIWDDRVVLDFALNPDFSQVESDEPQIVTNERFETFFPEKRPFFIENADYFSTPLNLLFTRKIVNPNVGLRATAQVGDWSIGSMIIDDENATTSNIGTGDAKIFASNLRKSLGNDSFVGLFISDYSTAELGSKSLALQTRYRIDENWLMDSQLAYTDNSDVTNSKEAEAGYLALEGSGQNWRYQVEAQSVARLFDTSIGYIPRKGVTDISQLYSYRYLVNKYSLIAFTTEFELQNIWDTKGNYLDQLQSVTLKTELPGQTLVKFKVTNKSERLGPNDYEALNQLTQYNQDTYLVSAESSWFSSVGIEVSHKQGAGINYLPVTGKQPETAKQQQNVISLSYRPTAKLKFSLQFLENRLVSLSNERIFSSRQSRLKTSYQFSQDWSLRLIVKQDIVDASAVLSSMKDRNTVVGDFLLRWQSTPGNALFLGYGTSRDDYEKLALNSVVSDEERRLFLKFSHRLNF